MITGVTPGGRYGHSLAYVQESLVLFGGNTGSKPLNDCWILPLSTEILSWFSINLPADKIPSARLYHSAAICTRGIAKRMMIIFGGRDAQENSLNDTWGLRRHNNGSWDWAQAPYKNDYKPATRYNVTL